MSLNVHYTSIYKQLVKQWTLIIFCYNYLFSKEEKKIGHICGFSSNLLGWGGVLILLYPVWGGIEVRIIF